MSAQKFLAVDYGTKRVGVAIHHAWLAEPYAVYDRASALERIVEVIQKEHIDTIILGIAEGKMADDARKFGEELRVRTGLPVIEEDETLTSVETHEKLARSSMPKNRRQKPIDHYAAAEILQNYLDTHERDGG